MHVNEVTLIGQADRVKFFDGQTPRVSLSVKCTRTFTKKGGETGQITDYVSAVLWGKQVEALKSTLKDGALVYGRGHISNRRYEKDGETKWVTEVNLETLTTIGAGAASKPASPGVSDDDIPF